MGHDVSQVGKQIRSSREQEQRTPVQPILQLRRSISRIAGGPGNGSIITGIN